MVHNREEGTSTPKQARHLEPNGLLFPKGRKCLSRVNCFSFFGIYDEKLERCIGGSRVPFWEKRNRKGVEAKPLERKFVPLLFLRNPFELLFQSKKCNFKN